MGKHGGISLMAAEIVEEVKTLNGLCTKKFHADILTHGIDYKALKEGDVIEADGKAVKITRVGKPCFDECPLEKKPCILNGNVAFGEATDK